MSDHDVIRVHAEIVKLPVAAKLELAAVLWRAGKRGLAATVAERAHLEMVAQMHGLVTATTEDER